MKYQEWMQAARPFKHGCSMRDSEKCLPTQPFDSRARINPRRTRRYLSW